MSIVKEIIDRMNGTIKVESEYGVGTTTTIKVRQKIAGEGMVSEYTEATVKKDEEVKTKRVVAPDAKVLVVDDNSMNLKVAKGLLKDTLVNVSTVDGGAEAIELTKNEKFDIILLDAFMPTIDGPQVFKTIREDSDNPNNSTPIIVVTADALSDSRQKFMDMGFDEYLSKPLKQQLLFEVLFSFLPEELVEEREGE
jgi:CheY-like chemotaxis protein